jgi:hypothetical protein
MRRHLVLSLSIASLSAAVACSSASSDSSSPSPDKGADNAEWKAAVASPRSVELTRASDGKRVVAAVVGNNLVIEGDIVVGDVRVYSGTLPDDSVRKWPVRDGVVRVPYFIGAGLAATKLDEVMGAIEEWQTRANVVFERVPPSTPAPFVRFDPASVCQSPIGMAPNGTVIAVGDDCSTGNIIHEIGHALGLYHEQSRTDRDDFVALNQANYAGQQGGWDVNFGRKEATPRGPYDFTSLMHYGSCFFAKEPCNSADYQNATLVRKSDNGFVEAQRFALSEQDVAGFEQLYGIAPRRPTGPNGSAHGVSRSWDKIDVFNVRNDGRLWTSYWWVGGSWNTSPVQGSLAGRLPGGARVASVSRRSENIDAFAIDVDGTLVTSFWHPSSAGMTAIPDTFGTGTPGAAVAAVGRMPSRLDAFYVTNNGSLTQAEWRETNPPSRWAVRQIASGLPSGAALSAVSRTADHIDLFWVHGDGSVRTAFFSAVANRWQVATITAANVAPPGARIAATARTARNLDVFFVANNGAVHTAFWTPGAPWTLRGITAPNLAPAGGEIAAVTRSAESLDVFVIDGNSAISSAWWRNGTANWQWATLTRPSFAANGRNLSAVARAADKLDVFVRTADGLKSMFWYLGAPGWGTHTIY